MQRLPVRYPHRLLVHLRMIGARGFEEVQEMRARFVPIHRTHRYHSPLEFPLIKTYPVVTDQTFVQNMYEFAKDSVFV